MDSKSVWGLVFVAFVLAGAIPALWAASNDPGGEKSGDDRVIRMGTVWAPALLTLTATYGLEWDVVPATVLSIAVGLLVFLARSWKERTLRPTIRKEWRPLIAATGIWWLALQLWGFVWDWERYFDGSQFLALHLGAPLIGVAGLAAWRWMSRD